MERAGGEVAWLHQSGSICCSLKYLPRALFGLVLIYVFFLTNFSTAGGLNMIATYPAIQYVGKKAYLMSKSGHESVKHCGEVP